MVQNVCDALVNNENIIPVIGYDMLTIVDEKGERKSYLDYLSKKIFDDCKLSVTDRRNKVVINLNEKGFTLFNQVVQKLLAENDFNFQVTRSRLSEFAIEIHSKVDKSYLEKIVGIAPFKYFFNLTFTTHLSEVVSSNRSFPNISLKQSMFPFNFKTPKKPEDVIKNNCNFEAIIYNVAGLAYSGNKKLFDYYYSDDDILEFIPEFTKRYEKDLSNYREVVNDSSLLFLGCQYPDWLIRILINILKPDSLRKNNAVQARVFFDYCQDNSNSFFLTKHGFTFQENIITTELVDQLYQTLSDPNNQFTLGVKNNDFVFISYTRDNLPLAQKIVCQLSTQMNVWFDRIKMFPGDSINSEVISGIDNCKLFLPIITQESVKKAPADYVRQEWIHYGDKFRDHPKIIPLIHKDVNVGTLGLININEVFANAGSNLFFIQVDDNGLEAQDISRIKKECS